MSNKEKSNTDAGKPKLRPLYALAAAGILLAVGVIGAALMAEHLSRSKDGDVKIYRSDAPGTDTSSKKSVKETAAVPVNAGLSKTETEAPAAAVTTTSTAAETSAAFSFPADLNRVSFEQLCSVSGINRPVAESIIEYREKHGVIRNYDELLDIYGIGERTIAVIREHFFISGDDYREPVTATVTSAATVSKTTTAEQTTASASSTTRQTTSVTQPEVKEMRQVDIQTADAAEIADALLIDEELAEGIVELREKIGAFNDIREVLYVEGFTDQMFLGRREYMTLSYTYDDIKGWSNET